MVTLTSVQMEKPKPVLRHTEQNWFQISSSLLRADETSPGRTEREAPGAAAGRAATARPTSRRSHPGDPAPAPPPPPSPALSNCPCFCFSSCLSHRKSTARASTHRFSLAGEEELIHLPESFVDIANLQLK